MGMLRKANKPVSGKVSVSEVAQISSIPVRTMYGMKARHPELWSLLEDGVRLRRIKAS